MRIPLLVALVGLIGIGAPAQAQVARQEVHAFQSVTLSDTEFLNGKQDGKPVTLSGLLRLPKVGPEKLPAVVLLHGAGGMGGSGSQIDEWSLELNQIGIATFAVDSWSGRGIVETVTDQTRAGRLNRIVDAYRALELLAKHRQIDPARIVLMGFSHGGQSTLYSSVTRFRKAYGPTGEQEFAAHIALYPACMTTYRGDDQVIARPIRVLHGTADDYNPIAPCRAYVERVSKLGKDIRLVEYPDAHHVFDAPAVKEARKLTAAPTTARCVLAEGDNGVITNEETKQPFSYGDACVVKGPTLAYHEAASNQARVYVRTFLKEVFALK
jgi:dienelactone hydrolase